MEDNSCSTHGLSGGPERDKGFAHFETFDEVHAWHENQVDGLQRSNTPLFARPTCGSEGHRGAKIMLIHDYSGGYGDYEICQGTVVTEESYACEYLQYVSTFVYFSHKLVVIPPPTWTNTCHRNGVKVLGTFLIEPGSSQVDRIFATNAEGRFWVADKLARMARIFAFDGWLINIEKSFPILRWDSSRLERFLLQLREQLGNDCQVVWYDALTSINVVWYQNTLSSWNLRFALAAGAILTNYRWTPQLARSARSLAVTSGLGPENVYFGIDVWAQNEQPGQKRRRVTYPEDGGGGTGTGLGVSALAKLHLNAGIFAPGWSFEHFEHHSRAVERAVWTGKALPVDLACDCRLNDAHTSVQYRENPVANSVVASRVGTPSFFYTDFRRAFFRVSPTSRLYSHMGTQSPLPRPASVRVCHEHSRSSKDSPCAHLSTKICNDPPRLLVAYESALAKTCSGEPRFTGTLHLYDLGIHHVHDIEITVKYRRLETSTSFSLKLDFADGSSDCASMSLSNAVGQAATSNHVIRSDQRAAVIAAIGLAFEMQPAERNSFDNMQLLELFELSVRPYSQQKTGCKLDNLRIERRRIIWDLLHDREADSESSVLPFSEITGPCAYFEISIDDNIAGRAYALEYILSAGHMRQCTASESIKVRTTAFGFDGVVLDTLAATLCPAVTDADDWILVSMER